MKSILKIAAAVAVTAFFAANANAQTYQNRSAPNGGTVIVSIWDNIAGVSLVYAVPGAFYQDLADGDLSAFSTPIAIPDFATTFALSSVDDIQFSVVAGGFEAPAASVFLTGPLGGIGPNNSNVNGASTNIDVFYGQLDGICGNDSPCIATSASEGNFAGQPSFGAALGGLPFSVAGGIGDTLAFFNMSNSIVSGPFGDIPGPATDPAVVSQVAQTFFELDENGTLTVVPLPAAAWLLLSGLFGFGAIARRRSAAAA